MESNIVEQQNESTSPPPVHTENPQVQPDSPKRTKQNLDTKPSSIQKSKPSKPKSPEKQKSPPKNNLEDEMEKYFQEYGVMESVPSNKKLHNQTKTLKKEKPKQQDSEQEQSNIDQQQIYRYKQLQNKLNLALNKIQICKDSSVKSLKISTQESDEMYKRFQYYQKKRKEEIEKKKQQRQDEEIRQLQNKPIINPTSSRIVGSLQPIYQRYERVLNQKQKRLEEQRIKMKKQKEEEEQLFFRDFEQRNKKPDNVRTTEQFYEGLVRWKEKKQEKNKQKQQIQDKQELADATFQPIINQRSKRLLAKKPQRQPIFTRQPKPRPVVQEYTFKPKINKKVPSYK